MAGFNECVEEIIKASGDKLSKREAAELLRKFNEATAKLPINDRISSLSAIVADLNENMVRRNDAFNVIAKQQELMKEAWHINTLAEAKLRLQDVGPSKLDKVSGLNHKVKNVLDQMLYGTPGKKLGLVQRYESVRQRFNVALVAPLEEKGLMSHWKDTDTVNSAVQFAFNPNSTTISKEAQEIGAVLRDMYKLAVSRLNKAGSYVLPSPNILFNTRVADSAKVRAMGKEAFVDFVRGLNIDQTHFKGMEQADIDKFIETSFDRLSSGDQYRAPTGKFDGIGGLTKERYRNLGSSNSLDFNIPFADADSFLKFHSALSDEPIQASIARRVDSIGRAVGLMENFTVVPERAMDDLLAALEPDMTPDDKTFLLGQGSASTNGIGKDVLTAAPRLIQRMFIDANPKDLLADLSGATSIPVDYTAARAGALLRTWSSMASLANGVFIQLTDMPFKVAQLIKYGNDPFSTIVSPITAFATHTFTSEERKLFYSRLGVSAELMMRSMSHAAQDGGNGQGFSARAMDLYFKANLMAPFDRIQKQHTADFVSSNLAFALTNKNESMLGLFRQYGFTDADFEKLGRSVAAIEGIEVVDPQRIKGIDDALYERYLGTMQSIINDVTPTPGARERAALRKGSRPGTVMGEILRTGTMFKNYPVMLMTRVYPQIQYEHGTAGTMATMLGLLTMWYIGDSMKQLSQGKTPRDMSKPANVVEAMVKSGMGGLFTDYITNDYRANGMDLGAVIGGPVIGHLQDLLELGSAATRVKEDPDTGEFKSELTGKMAAQKLNRAIPNVHFAKTALEHTLIYGIMEMQDPGSVQASYDRIKERTGQERLF